MQACDAIRFSAHTFVHRYLLRWFDVWWVPGGVAATRRALANAIRRPAILPPQRQLFVDVSIIAASDAGTGIQRVVRSIAEHLLADPPEGMTVHLVRATRKLPYRYATQYQRQLTGKAVDGSDAAADDVAPDVRPGDIFLGLDLCSRPLPMRQRELRLWRKSGARCAFVVYDLLPLVRPEWFTSVASRSFQRWLDTLAIHGDALFCISNAVANDVSAWLQNRMHLDRDEILVDWFHLGADFRPTDCVPSAPRTTLLPRAREITTPTVLMVGTVEPRKGHAEILTAFEALWGEGVEARLVIAGKQGWKVDALAERIKALQSRPGRLVWINDASDAELTQWYQSVDGVIMASEAEGFGLPIVEAALRDIPLLLRDIPVFREVAGEHARYFGGAGSSGVVDSLRDWLRELEEGAAIRSKAMTVLTWQQSAERLGQLIAKLR
ncbi:glycosyltransferase family 4 protein [Burkholderia sp. 3C]